MQDDSLTQGLASAFLPGSHAPTAAERAELARAIAPWWHTAAILLLLTLWASIGGKRQHSYTDAAHVSTYLGMIMMTWMLFGSVIAGIRHRETFFFNTLRRRARSLFADAGVGLGVYVGIYACIITLAMFGAMLFLGYRAVHDTPAKPPITQSSTSPAPRPATPLPPPTPTSPLDALRNSPFHVNSKTVLAIAPKTPLDLLLWVLISMTAGFCEEHIFRGYLLSQALALTQRWGASRLLSATLSVIVTSLIFGSLHVYEGVGGAAVVAVLGVAYSVVSLKLGNLRAVIVAHFLQDFVSGFFLFLFNKLHML